MDITQMLYLYPEIEDRVSRLRKEIAIILEDKYELKSSTVVSTTTKQRLTDDGICKMIESCDEQIKDKQRRIDLMLKLKDDIDHALATLDHAEQEIIRLKYFELQSGTNIAEKMNVSTKYLYNKIGAVKSNLAKAITVECDIM